MDITVDKCLPGKTLRKANNDSATLTCECDFKAASELILSCESDQMIILRVCNQYKVTKSIINILSTAIGWFYCL